MKRATPVSSSRDPVRKRLSGMFRRSRDSFPNNSRRMGSASKNSSMLRRRVDQGPPRDPRNLSSKATQREMIDELLYFLQIHDYPHHITSKILQAPSSKDFIHIFEFLYRFIDCTEKIGKKIEEEFPRLMKQLRYPFPIAKSAMFSIGSLHTWPNLLGALHWLVKLIEITSNIDPEQLIFGNCAQDPEARCQRLIHEFNIKKYKDFMEEIPSDGQDELALRNALIAESGISEEERETVRLENEMLERRVAELEAESNQVEELQQNIEKWKAECQMLEKKLEDLKEEKRLQDKKEKELDEELGKYDYKMIKEVRSKDAILHERESWINRFREAETKNDYLQSRCWEEELTFSRASSKLYKDLGQYDDQKRMILCNPKALEYLGGHDIDLKYDHQQTEIGAPSKFRSVIKDVLLGAEQRLLADVRNLESDVVTEQEKLGKLTDSTKDAELKFESVNSNLERATFEFDNFVERSDKEQKELNEKLALLMEEKLLLERGSNALVDQKKAELSKLKERLEKDRIENEEKLKNMADFVTKVALKASGHTDCIQAAISHTKELELKRKQELDVWEQYL